MLYPIIKVRDKQTGTEHIVGENIHDALSITENGQLQYINYQCLDGTGDDGAYQFVDGTEGNYREIEFVTLDQLIDMAAEHLETATKAKIMAYKSLRKIMDAELQKTKKETGIIFDTGGMLP